MNEDQPSSTITRDGRVGRKANGNGSQTRTLLERLGHIFQAEPKDREALVEVLRDAHQRGLMDSNALAMIEGVLDVSELQVRDIMIPRSQMAVVERGAALEEFLPTIVEAGHSRFPVIGENRDEVLGLLLAKDLLPFAAQGGEAFNIREVLRPAFIVPESKRLNILLKEFQASRNHMAIVVDEYGGVAGLITIEDVIEQIVGEIADEHDIEDEETDILPDGEGRYTVRALTPIDDFNEFFGSDLSDEEFDTVGGVVVNAFGHLPKRDEAVQFKGFRFAVLRADNRQVHLLEVEPMAPDEEAEDEAEEIRG